MPMTNEDTRLESRASAFTALLALICGAVLMSISYGGWQSESVEIVDHLVKFDSGYVSGRFGEIEIPVLTTQRIMRSVFTMSICVVIVAIIGVVGSLMRQKGAVCAYVLLGSCLSLVVLVSAAQTSQRRLLAAPLLMRQAEDLCNSTTYIRLTAQLGCEFASNYNESEISECGVLCKRRVNRLRRNHGCKVLPRLCSTFSFEQLQRGGCLNAASKTGMAMYRHIGNSMGIDGCRSECDDDIGCDTFINFAPRAGGETQCIVISARASVHNPANWSEIKDGFLQYVKRTESSAAIQQVSDHLDTDEINGTATSVVGGWTHQCFRRRQPQVLLDFMDRGFQLAVNTAVLAAILLLSTFCTCCILYNVNMSRRGLPTAIELGLMMLCPCFANNVHRKFHEDYFVDSEEASHGKHSEEGEDSDDDSNVE